MNRVYICSPYRANTEADKQRNIAYAQELVRIAVKCGWAPYAPHLYLPDILNDEDAEQREKGINIGLSFLKSCKAIIVGAKYGVSEGMQNEIDWARVSGKSEIWMHAEDEP